MSDSEDRAVRILIAEDDPALSRILAKGLREQAYAVDIAHDGPRALEQAAVNRYDAIVLDVLMPGLSGLAVCDTLRARGDATPVLMLTARDAVTDRIAGLDAGADDYLTKPFALSELLARLRALLRRAPLVRATVITVADLEIDTRRQCAMRAGRQLTLTAKEYSFLEFLARHEGQVVDRKAICAHVWDENHDPLSNVIEVYVNRLRRKVDGPGDVPLIHTRRGAGYLLAALASDAAGARNPPAVPRRWGASE